MNLWENLATTILATRFFEVKYMPLPFERQETLMGGEGKIAGEEYK